MGLSDSQNIRRIFCFGPLDSGKEMETTTLQGYIGIIYGFRI